jgi:hypothetical protein
MNELKSQKIGSVKNLPAKIRIAQVKANKEKAKRQEKISQGMRSYALYIN